MPFLIMDFWQNLQHFNPVFEHSLVVSVLHLKVGPNKLIVHVDQVADCGHIDDDP